MPADASIMSWVTLGKMPIQRTVARRVTFQRKTVASRPTKVVLCAQETTNAVRRHVSTIDAAARMWTTTIVQPAVRKASASNATTKAKIPRSIANGALQPRISRDHAHPKQASLANKSSTLGNSVNGRVRASSSRMIIPGAIQRIVGKHAVDLMCSATNGTACTARGATTTVRVHRAKPTVEMTCSRCLQSQAAQKNACNDAPPKTVQWLITTRKTREPCTHVIRRGMQLPPRPARPCPKSRSGPATMGHFPLGYLNKISTLQFVVTDATHLKLKMFSFVGMWPTL
jgi:hypothetical protein